uniref:Peptidase S1 domain-containing protein n=1 Tax=Romanomermis culicivorax TaxID=13658 RepID=A0A915KLR0_ROMCU
MPWMGSLTKNHQSICSAILLSKNTRDKSVYRNFEPSDISLVKLNKAIKFDSYINGLCLPDKPEEKDAGEFSTCLTCGWGATKVTSATTFPRASNELQCIEVKVELEKPDHIRRKSLLTIQWQEKSLQGPYKGDSGSPLFCRLIYDAKKFLYGIVMSGATFTVSGLTYFERIPSNLEWINQ